MNLGSVVSRQLSGTTANVQLPNLIISSELTTNATLIVDAEPSISSGMDPWMGAPAGTKLALDPVSGSLDQGEELVMRARMSMDWEKLRRYEGNVWVQWQLRVRSADALRPGAPAGGKLVIVPAHAVGTVEIANLTIRSGNKSALGLRPRAAEAVLVAEAAPVLIERTRGRKQIVQLPFDISTSLPV